MNVDNSIVFVFVIVFVTVNDLTLLRGRPAYAEYVATSIVETYKCVGGTGIWRTRALGGGVVRQNQSLTAGTPAGAPAVNDCPGAVNAGRQHRLEVPLTDGRH